MKSKKKRNIMIAAACMVAFVFSIAVIIVKLDSSLNASSETATEDFTSILDQYTHSFELYEKLLQREIALEKSENDILAYLKKSDEEFKKIDGSNYDGIYMYYKGQYLYSWDTPYFVYEENGYKATERPWYTGAIEADGDIWFSVPYRSYANEYMLSTISRLQPDGETVIAYDIKLGAIQSFAEKLDLYRGSLTILCDQDANIIGTTNSLYAGGNYLQSESEYDKQIAEAKKAIGSVDDDEKVKTEKEIESLQALKEFSKKMQHGLKNLVEDSGRLHCHMDSGNLVYSYSNGRYDCITLVPIQRILPTVLLFWAAISAVLILLILLYENMMERMQSAKELEKKNRQLAEAVERADAANVSKSQFLAQMSHEIRTPMNAVIGLTGIAKTETASPEKVTEYLTKIEGSSRLLLSIINDVLDMSAIEGGKMIIDNAEFNFRNMLTNITTLFYEQTRQKGIHFEVRMNGVTEEIMLGDELRVNQVLMNLLSNAVKFTPANGEIDLMVQQASSSQGKVQLRFVVSDTGCGMSNEMMGRLFQPFEQESAATARKHGGSGLGLSITKRLVEMMGGSIQVQSTVGKGSVFTVDIPFGMSEKTEMTATKNFEDVHALVVDDDQDSCEYSGILLERLGVRYEFVTNGEDALEKIGEAEDKEDPFTLCLIDWKMPGMNGGELTEKIRDIFGDETIIIIVSAYNLDEVEDSGRAMGSNYFIPKPLFQSTLFNALMKISGGDYTKNDVRPQKEAYDFSGKCVLVAEDVILNMEVAVKLLGMVGIEVVCAEDGKQAYDVFNQSAPGRFDCILMDINMPVMDGYEATRAIRSCHREDAKTIPIYAMTANAFAEDVTAALDAGMNGHIAKPIETSVLYRTLETAFSAEDEEYIEE